WGGSPERKSSARMKPVASEGHRVADSNRSSRTAQKRLAARLSARCRFELLDAAFDLIQPLIGPLCGLIGGFGALGRALHPRVELIEARVDGCKLVVIGGAAGKAQGGDERHAERSRRRQMLL